APARGDGAHQFGRTPRGREQALGALQRGRDATELRPPNDGGDPRGLRKARQRCPRIAPDGPQGATVQQEVRAFLACARAFLKPRSQVRLLPGAPRYEVCKNSGGNGPRLARYGSETLVKLVSGDTRRSDGGAPRDLQE